jgi:hypothetical protein
MGLLVRFPRLAAWMVVLVLVGVGTLGALQGLQALEPEIPSHLDHIHGTVVAMRAGDRFAVRVQDHTRMVWFRIAQGAPISLAHIQRHLQEHAPTDVYYQDQGKGLPLAWVAD